MVLSSHPYFHYCETLNHISDLSLSQQLLPIFPRRRRDLPWFDKQTMFSISPQPSLSFYPNIFNKIEDWKVGPIVLWNFQQIRPCWYISFIIYFSFTKSCQNWAKKVIQTIDFHTFVFLFYKSVYELLHYIFGNLIGYTKGLLQILLLVLSSLFNGLLFVVYVH